MPRDGHAAGLDGVLQLPMTSSSLYNSPTVVVQLTQQITEFHPAALHVARDFILRYDN